MESSLASKTTTVGTRLRAARMARGLSVDDVAQSLKLATRIIEAIEDDAYDRLPSPTYVRGYLRGYAMLLGLPPQELIDSFNTTPQAARRVDMTVPAPVRETNSSDVTVRFGTLLVAVLVIGLSVMWWLGKDGSSARRRATAPTTTTENVSKPAEADSASASSVVEAPTKAAEPVMPPSVPAESPPTTAVAPANVPTPTVASSASSPIPDTPRARLVLRVSEDSWADVRDADQRRLLYETLPAGRVATIEGVPPLSVFLGNVEGVALEFNGQPYDALRHKRGQVARFTLGSAGSN